VKSSYALNSHSPPNVVSILFEFFSQFSFLLLIRLEVCCSVFILIVVAREDDEDLVWHHMVHVFLLCLHFVSHSTSIHSLSYRRKNVLANKHKKYSNKCYATLILTGWCDVVDAGCLFSFKTRPYVYDRHFSFLSHLVPFWTKDF
jgi:hypothetical protein